MKIIRTVEEMKKALKHKSDQSVGFVPTMGYLHEGHLSLVERARKDNDIVALSIFVNPLQFGPNEDFERYPRDEEHDAREAKQAGVDLLFIPTVETMYPEKQSIEVQVNKGTDVLCGRSRPGHFNGVATVLAKLFHIVQPDKTYFGLKDAQQFAVVHSLIDQLNFPIKLIGLPTVREADGLAKSSRNVYLSATEREQATVLYESLQLGQRLITDGTKERKEIIDQVKDYILANTDGKIDYVELLSYPKLEEVEQVDEQVILAIALDFAQARLIDNIILSPSGEQIDIIIK